MSDAVAVLGFFATGAASLVPVALGYWWGYVGGRKRRPELRGVRSGSSDERGQG